MTKKRVPRLMTPGVVAAKLGVPLHRVTYVLGSRPHIQHTATAGRFRLFDAEALAMIRHELAAIDARRGQGGDA